MTASLDKLNEKLITTMGQNTIQNCNNGIVDLIDTENISTENNESTKKYVCTFAGCDAAFFKPSRLTWHLRKHNGERPYKCNHPKCDKAYTNSSHLKRHMETHIRIKKFYPCNQCHLELSNLHNLKRHKLVHDKLTCKECNIVFNKKYQLKQHILTHTGVLYHKCDKCTKSFVNIRKFERHKESHLKGNKSYPCTIESCSEVFNKWTLLCQHMKTKHVVDYKCERCEKVFTTKSHLKVHSRIHSESRPLMSCPYEKCHKVYYFKYNLEAHIQSFHIGSKFYCDMCKAGLTTKQGLIIHIENVHNSKKKEKVRNRRKEKKKRKDVGIPKKSMVTKLIGLNLPHKVEKMLLSRITSIELSNESDLCSNA